MRSFNYLELKNYRDHATIREIFNNIDNKNQHIKCTADSIEAAILQSDSDHLEFLITYKKEQGDIKFEDNHIKSFKAFTNHNDQKIKALGHVSNRLIPHSRNERPNDLIVQFF